MNILLKNLLLYLNLDEKRHMKNVLEGIERLIELKEINLNNLYLDEEVQRMDYSKGSGRKTETLYEFLEYCNKENPTTELSGFLIKYYQEIPEQDLYLSSLENTLKKPSYDDPENENLIRDLNLIPTDILLKYLTMEQKTLSEVYQEIQNYSDIITCLRYKDRIKHTSEEMEKFEEEMENAEKEQDKLYKRKKIIEQQESIYNILLVNPKKLESIINFIPKEHFLKTYSNFSFDVKINFDLLMKIENILPGFSRTSHRSGVLLYEKGINNSLKEIHSLLYYGHNFFDVNEIKNIENKAVNIIFNSNNYNSEASYKLKTLAQIENWYSRVNEDGKDMLSFALENLCSQDVHGDFEFIIEQIKSDEKFKKYLLERNENILAEIIINSYYKISLYNNLVKIIPELKDKSVGECVLLESISSVYNINKGVLSKRNKILEKVDDNILIGNDPNKIINFFIHEKWNSDDLRSNSNLNDILKMLNVIENRMDNYNKKTSIIDQDLFKNLSKWSSLITSKNVTGKYGHYNGIENDIINILVDSGLPIDILKKFKTIRTMMENEFKEKAIKIAFEKITIKESIGDNIEKSPSIKKRM